MPNRKPMNQRQPRLNQRFELSTPAADEGFEVLPSGRDLAWEKKFPTGQVRISIARDMSLSFPRLALLLLVVTTASFGCGGTRPVDAKPASHMKARTVVESDSEKTETPGPNCADGTCFPCGPGICIPGFFCDETSAQPNCQWLSKCGRSTNCECLKETFGNNCACTERSGGIYVKCST